MKLKLKTILLIALIIVVTAIIVTGCIMYIKVTPKLKLVGDKEIILNLNDEYKEKGAKASILGKDVSENIIKEGEVDTTKVGEYKINYNISSVILKNMATKTRIVKVIDNINPEIKLKGNNVKIYVGEKYNEPGYSASDNYDGEITKDVKVTNNIDTAKVGKYEVVYSVIDSSGNKHEIKRTVEVEKKPVVTYSYSGGGGSGLPVLMYHFFYDASKGQKGQDNNWMEISDFENQMKYLSDNGYYFPSWDEVADFVDGKISLPKKSIVITADDAHNSFFELAVPVINKYNVKATSFVITRWTGERVLSKYRGGNVQFETHTHNMHQGGCSGGLIKCISYEEGMADLKQSIEIVGSKKAIAYPFGDYNDHAIKMLKDTGIKLAFTTAYGKVYKGMDKLKLPRVRMNKGTSLNGFISAIS